MRVVNTAVSIVLIMIALLNAGCSNFRKDSLKSVGVEITGVQHMGRNYSVREFYLDGYPGGNVGRSGGGGSHACCIMLPVKWSSGLSVLVKWSVANWEKADLVEVAHGNFSSVKKEGPYIASVPVEKYIEPGNLYVHFLSDGRVRVVPSSVEAFGKGHPISNDRQEGELAVQGVIERTQDDRPHSGIEKGQ